MLATAVAVGTAAGAAGDSVIFDSGMSDANDNSGGRRPFEMYTAARREEGRAEHPRYYAQRPYRRARDFPSRADFVDGAGVRYCHVRGDPLALDYKLPRGSDPAALRKAHPPGSAVTLTVTAAAAGLELQEARCEVVVESYGFIGPRGQQTGRVRIGNSPTGPYLTTYGLLTQKDMKQ